MFYQWVIFVHVLSVLVFLLAHGVAAAVMLSLRTEREPASLRVLLALSRPAHWLSNIAVVLILVSGLLGGFLGQWWGRGWIWASLALPIALGVVMSSLGREYFARVRTAWQRPK